MDLGPLTISPSYKVQYIHPIEGIFRKRCSDYLKVVKKRVACGRGRLRRQSPVRGHRERAARASKSGEKRAAVHCRGQREGSARVEKDGGAPVRGRRERAVRASKAPR